MATGKSVKEIIEAITKNDAKYSVIDFTHLGIDFSLSTQQQKDIVSALTENTVITSVNFMKTGIVDDTAKQIGTLLKTNSVITSLDLGYNNITKTGMGALSEGLMENNTLIECKLHRQEKDMGTAAEDKFVKLWESNTVLQKMYITLHDRRCNQTNTLGEVRNKKIAARIKAGKNWDDLDPAKAKAYQAEQERLAKIKKEEEEKKNKAIDEKVPSTGGPYTLKQLTCEKKFQPDDIDIKKKETYLEDEEFESLFKMKKEEFAALPNWKKLNKKKEMKLH